MSDKYTDNDNTTAPRPLPRRNRRSYEEYTPADVSARLNEARKDLTDPKSPLAKLLSDPEDLEQHIQKVERLIIGSIERAFIKAGKKFDRKTFVEGVASLQSKSRPAVSSDPVPVEQAAPVAQEVISEKKERPVTAASKPAPAPVKTSKPEEVEKVVVVDKKGDLASVKVGDLAAAQDSADEEESDDTKPRGLLRRAGRDIFSAAFPTLSKLTKKDKRKEAESTKEKLSRLGKDVFKTAFPTINKVIEYVEGEKKQKSTEGVREATRSRKSLDKTESMSSALQLLTAEQKKSVDLLQDLLETVKGLGGGSGGAGGMFGGAGRMLRRAAPMLAGAAAVGAVGLGAYAISEMDDDDDAEGVVDAQSSGTDGAAPPATAATQTPPAAQRGGAQTTRPEGPRVFRRSGTAGELSFTYERTADGKHYIDGREVDAQTYNRVKQIMFTDERDPRYQQILQEEAARDSFAPDMRAKSRLVSENAAELNNTIQRIRTQPVAERPAAVTPAAPGAAPAAQPAATQAPPPSADSGLIPNNQVVLPQLAASGRGIVPQTGAQRREESQERERQYRENNVPLPRQIQNERLTRTASLQSDKQYASEVLGVDFNDIAGATYLPNGDLSGVILRNGERRTLAGRDMESFRRARAEQSRPQSPAAEPPAPAAAGPRISSGTQARITRPPATPALGEGSMAATPYGADVGAMGLEPVQQSQPSTTTTRVNSQGNFTFRGVNVPFSAQNGVYMIGPHEVNEATFNEFRALRDTMPLHMAGDFDGLRQRNVDTAKFLDEVMSGKRTIQSQPQQATQPITAPTPQPAAPIVLPPAPAPEPAPTATERSPGLLSRIFGRGRSEQPAVAGPRISSGAQPRITRPPAAPALGEGAMAASPYGADVGAMGLEPQSAASPRAGNHVHTEAEKSHLKGIVRGALGPNRREHVDEVVEQLLTLPFPFFRGRPLPRSNFGIESVVRDYINSRPELRDPAMGQAIQRLDAGGRETFRMVEEQQQPAPSAEPPASTRSDAPVQDAPAAPANDLASLISNRAPTSGGAKDEVATKTADTADMAKAAVEATPLAKDPSTPNTDMTSMSGMDLVLRARTVTFKGDEIEFVGSTPSQVSKPGITSIPGIAPSGAASGGGGGGAAAPAPSASGGGGGASSEGSSSQQLTTEQEGAADTGSLTFASGVDPRIKKDIAQKVQQIESAFGKKLTITSGFRDPQRNAAAGGARNSAHTRANAVDIRFQGNEEETNKLIEAASAAGIGGIGVYRPGWVHLDVESKRVWGPDFSARSIPEWSKDTLQAHMTGQIQKSPAGEAAAAEPVAASPASPSMAEAPSSGGGGEGGGQMESSGPTAAAPAPEPAGNEMGAAVAGASQENAVAERTPVAPTVTAVQSESQAQPTPGAAVPDSPMKSVNDPGSVEPDDAAERYTKLFNMAA